MAAQWFYRIFGEEFGPINEAKLLSLRDGGTLADDDDVRPVGETAWRPLGKTFAGGASSGEAPAPAVVASADTGDDELNWYYKLADEILGPLTFRELLELAEAGAVAADSEVRFGASGKFRQVGSIGRLVSVLPYRLPERKTSTSAAAASPAAAVEAQATNSAPPAATAAPTVRYHPQADEAAWYAWIQGTEYGPVSLLQLSQWMGTGQLGATDFVKYGPYNAWLPPTPTVSQALAPLTIHEMAPSVAVPVAHPAPKTQVAAVSAPSATAATSPAKATPELPKPQPAAPSASAASKTAFDDKPAAAPTQSAASPSAAAKVDSHAAAATPVPVKPPASAAVEKPVAAESPVAPPPAAAPASTSSPIPAKPATNLSAGGYGSAAMSSIPARPAPTSSARPKASSGGGMALDLGALFGNPVVLGSIAAVLVIGALVGLFFVLPANTAGDRDKLQKLQQILAEFRRNRDDKITAPQWESFTTRTEQTVKPMVEELKSTANRKYPARQFLLWAARDRLPEVLSGAREKPTPAEAEFEYNLKKSMFYLGMGADPDANQAATAAAD